MEVIENKKSKIFSSTKNSKEFSMEISKERIILAESIFWAHVLIVIPIIGLFFVPLRILPARETVHLAYLGMIIITQAGWGLFLFGITGHFMNTCPVTTFMQSVRGHDIKDPINHKHSFVAEFFTRYGITSLNSKRVNYMLMTVLFIATLRFVF